MLDNAWAVGDRLLVIYSHVTRLYLRFCFCFVSFVLVYIELQLRQVLVLFECVRSDSVYISCIWSF